MVVARYKSNSKSSPEFINIHKYESDGKLRIEVITNSWDGEVGGVYETLSEVEAFLAKRDRVFGYTRTW